jgi:hypothetical protein
MENDKCSVKAKTFDSLFMRLNEAVVVAAINTDKYRVYIQKLDQFFLETDKALTKSVEGKVPEPLPETVLFKLTDLLRTLEDSNGKNTEILNCLDKLM